MHFCFFWTFYIGNPKPDKTQKSLLPRFEDAHSRTPVAGSTRSLTSKRPKKAIFPSFFHDFFAGFWVVSPSFPDIMLGFSGNSGRGFSKCWFLAPEGARNQHLGAWRRLGIFSNIWPLARPNIAGEGSGLLKTYWARRLCWPAARKLRNSGIQNFETLIFLILALTCQQKLIFFIFFWIFGR